MRAAEARELFAYDAWAQHQILDAAAAIPADVYARDGHSSHGGIHGTLCHIVNSARVWMDRWLARPVRPPLGADRLAGLAEVRREWDAVREDCARFAAGLTDAKLEERLTMTTSKGERYEHRYDETLRHFVNHGSYHRGQVVALLRQAGVVPPSTDLIRYYRTVARRGA